MICFPLLRHTEIQHTYSLLCAGREIYYGEKTTLLIMGPKSGIKKTLCLLSYTFIISPRNANLICINLGLRKYEFAKMWLSHANRKTTIIYNMSLKMAIFISTHNPQGKFIYIWNGLGCWKMNHLTSIMVR